MHVGTHRYWLYVSLESVSKWLTDFFFCSASVSSVSWSITYYQGELVQCRSCIGSVLYNKSEFHLWAYVEPTYQRFASQVWCSPTS
jgi:hypothetical protein